MQSRQPSFTIFSFLLRVPLIRHRSNFVTEINVFFTLMEQVGTHYNSAIFKFQLQDTLYNELRYDRTNHRCCAALKLLTLSRF